METPLFLLISEVFFFICFFFSYFDPIHKLYDNDVLNTSIKSECRLELYWLNYRQLSPVATTKLFSKKWPNIKRHYGSQNIWCSIACTQCKWSSCKGSSMLLLLCMLCVLPTAYPILAQQTMGANAASQTTH